MSLLLIAGPLVLPAETVGVDLGKSKSRDAVVRSFRAHAASADGFIEVYSEEDVAAGDEFRRPILRAAAEDVNIVAKVSRLNLPESGVGLRIHIGRPSTNEDTRVVVSHALNMSKRIETRIYLPSPAFSDLERFHYEVCHAYLLAYIDRLGEAGRFRNNVPRVPDWVVDGLLRNNIDDERVRDQLFVLDLWEHGRMPYFPGMIRDMKMSKGRGRALNTFFVRWMLERKNVFPAMLKRMAFDGKWDGAYLAELLSGAKEEIRQEYAFDEYMIKMKRSVLNPGEMTSNDVRTFSSRLNLYPPLFDLTFTDGTRESTFRRAIDLVEKGDALIRLAAYRKSYELQMAVVGRGEELSVAADAFVEFLQALAGGEKRERLTKLLNDAEEKLGVAFDRMS